MGASVKALRRAIANLADVAARNTVPESTDGCMARLMRQVANEIIDDIERHGYPVQGFPYGGSVHEHDVRKQEGA